METQGSQIFHKLSSSIKPSVLKNVLKKYHRKRCDQSENDKRDKVMIQHPSPSSFACIDCIFQKSHDWSPFFNESISGHMERLSSLLQAACIVCCLLGMRDYCDFITIERKELTKRLKKSKEILSHDDIKSKFIKQVSRKYSQLFIRFNIFYVLKEIAQSFLNCIRWHFAFGYIPIQICDAARLHTDEILKATKDLLFEYYENSTDYMNYKMHHYIATFFSILEYSYKNYKFLDPVYVKQNIIITSKHGRYNATDYDGDDIDLLSFDDDVIPDCTLNKISYAAHMMPHEYLYVFAHHTNAVQTIKKLFQSTVVVSSEPSFSINTANSKKYPSSNNDRDLLTNIDKVVELETMYSKLTEESKQKLKFHPCAMNMYDSEISSLQQFKIFQDMYQQLHHKLLTINLEEGQNDYVSDVMLKPSSSNLDLHDDPEKIREKTCRTIQEIEEKKNQYNIQQKLDGAIKVGKNLQIKVERLIKELAVSHFKMKILEEKEKGDKKSMDELRKEFKELTKTKNDLLVQISNMSTIIKNLSSRVTSTQEQNDQFFNLILKGRSLQTNAFSHVTWKNNSKDTDSLVDVFLNMLHHEENNNFSTDRRKQYEDVLSNLKLEVIPLFHNVRQKDELDLFNSWVPEYMHDKCTHVQDMIPKQSHSDAIQVYETSLLKVIDINPISPQERERVKQIAESEANKNDSIIKPTGPGGSLFTMKFCNIKFAESGNIDLAIDKGLSNMWLQLVKTVLFLDDSSFTNTGQKTGLGPTQATFEKFLIPFLTLLLGQNKFFPETVGFLIKLHEQNILKNGARNINAYVLDEIFEFIFNDLLEL